MNFSEYGGAVFTPAHNIEGFMITHDDETMDMPINSLSDLNINIPFDESVAVEFNNFSPERVTVNEGKLNLRYNSDEGIPMTGHFTIVPSPRPDADLNLHSDTGFDITINYCGVEYNLQTSQPDMNLLDMMHFQDNALHLESLTLPKLANLVSKSQLMKDFIASNPGLDILMKKAPIIEKIIPNIELIYGDKFVSEQAIAKSLCSLDGSLLGVLAHDTQSLVLSYVDINDSGLAAELDILGEEAKIDE
ncbi:hypothetical protein N9N97_02685 [Rickettsiaceae bacterium]|nr:hypothetical protein [Rickettsiaceae bacterium]